jgi:hypothetical protein
LFSFGGSKGKIAARRVRVTKWQTKPTIVLVRTV